MAWNSLAWQGSRAGSSSCGCLCGSLEGPSPPCAPGSALAPPHGRPCLTWLWDGSLPSGPTLWAKETLPHSCSGLFFSLPAAANALKGPRLVSGEPGGAVTIRCHYPPLPINSHQRKYWCRLRPLTWVCHTIVSTNHYTHLRYRGRVALTDFPQRGLFVVRLSQLSPEDVGHYRCGIGNTNNMLFFSMNLTISAGKAVPAATVAAGELITGSFVTVSPAANRRTPGTMQTIERQGTGWDRVSLTLGTSKTTASAKGRQTPGATGVVAPGTGSQLEGSIWATIPTPQSPASAIRGVSNTTEGDRVWSTRSLEANRTRASERERETTTGTDRQREETERVRIAPDTAEKVMATIRPSTLVSGKWMWETHQEEMSVSKPQALGSVEGTPPVAVVWTLEPTSIEMASAEGSSEGDLDTPAGDSGPQVTSSQALAARPFRPLGKDSQVKSISLEEKNISRMLTPVSSVLCPLMLTALVLLQRKLRRKRRSQETERSSGVTLIQMTQFPELSLQPEQLPQVERKMLQDDSPPLRASLSIPERDPGPQGIEG
uniref:Fc alpha and mu receptor n=1 Tax=Monodon monoceros TaxID=40151 RepID=A0A8C6BXE2_MONMO